MNISLLCRLTGHIRPTVYCMYTLAAEVRRRNYVINR
jgi:hypothetical protein